ncbi:MAG TPA: hypothetical protein VG711_12945, partial [Phycisphaerales bacterium]|nr:hypothetical protein [Phycisphaerales bacterium]
SKKRSGLITRWGGSRMQLSTELAEGVRVRLAEAKRGIFSDEEMKLAGPLMRVQERWSEIPGDDEVLIEQVEIEGVVHAFVFSFDGRAAHEGLSALAAYRLMQKRMGTVLVSSNDYGFELGMVRGVPMEEREWRELLSPEGLLEDVLAAVNTSTLARRAFREIARVAGLVMQGFGKRRKGARQMQASSGMFFEVFKDFDPGNMLLAQAQREVIEGELDFVRMRGTLERIERSNLVIRRTERLTPLAFPIWAESLRSHEMSNERWTERVKRMMIELEELADDERRNSGTSAEQRGSGVGRRKNAFARRRRGVVGKNSHGDRS